MGETFLETNDLVRELELPAADDEILQGNRCARVTTEDELVYNVWAPLSGRVVDINPTLERRGADCRISGVVSTWLIGVAPTNADEELPNLTHCPESALRCAGSRPMVVAIVLLTLILFVLVDLGLRLLMRRIDRVKIAKERREALDIGLKLEVSDEARV